MMVNTDYSRLAPATMASMPATANLTTMPQLMVMPRSTNRMDAPAGMPAFSPITMSTLPITNQFSAVPRSSLGALPTADDASAVTSSGGGGLSPQLTALLKTAMAPKKEAIEDKTVTDESVDLLATIRSLKQELMARKESTTTKTSRDGKITKTKTTVEDKPLLAGTPRSSAIKNV